MSGPRLQLRAVDTVPGTAPGTRFATALPLPVRPNPGFGPAQPTSRGALLPAAVNPAAPASPAAMTSERRAHASWTDQELFSAAVAEKAAGRPIQKLVAELCYRWKGQSDAVVRKVQRTYGRGIAEDVEDVFQEAVIRLIERGLDQFRGESSTVPGTVATPEAFFLRIVKHLAIDRYRRNREQLARAQVDDGGEESVREQPAEIERAVKGAQERESAREAKQRYWMAFSRLEREHPNEAAAWDLYRHQDVEDHDTCARLLGISVANSYKRVSRAQAHLKAYVLDLDADAASGSGTEDEVADRAGGVRS